MRRPMHRPTKLGSRLTGLAALSAGLSACGGKASPDLEAGDAASVVNRDADADRSAPADATASDAGSADEMSSDATAADDAQGTEGAASNVDAGATDATAGHAGDAGPSWTMAQAYLGNPAHTSSTLDPTLAPPLAAIWSFDPGLGDSVSYPLIAGGRVYFVYGSNASGSTQQLVAVDEHTGVTLWGPIGLTQWFGVSQAYDGERVFTVDRRGTVSAFDAATGAASWTRAPAGSLSSYESVVVAYKGRVYVADGATLTALDEGTGQVVWTAPTGGTLVTTPAVTDDGVYYAAGCRDLTAFDAATGSLLWHHLGTCSGFAGVAAVFDGRVYVVEGSATDSTDVFDARTGGFLASLPCFISPAFDEGQAYCNSRQALTAFDLTTGATRWTFAGDHQLNLGPFAAAGAVYVASDTGMMFAVDQATGAALWSTQVDTLGASSYTVGAEGILLTQLYASAGVVAYAHVDVPDAGVTLGDGAPPTPFTLISGTHPVTLAIDNANVYWADFAAAEVNKAPKTGGSPVTLWSSTTTRPSAVALDATKVYVVASGDFQGSPSAITAVPIAGNPTPFPLASSPNLIEGPIVAGPSLLYWVDGYVESMPKIGGMETAAVMGEVGALAVDASYLYWSALDGLHRQSFSGGPAQLLGVPPNPEPNLLMGYPSAAIAVDSTNAYYTQNSAGNPGSVGYVPIDGGAATVLASGRPGSLGSVAVDDRNVYWVEGSGTIQEGAIAAVPKTGGRVTVLVSGLSDPTGVAVDSTGVYFASSGGGIGKIAK